MTNSVIKTTAQYNQVMDSCTSIFIKKMNDYGSSWRVLRPSSMVDQIFIKARRIRTIEEKNMSLVEEGVDSEYLGIINYCILGIIQIRKGPSLTQDLSNESIAQLHQEIFKEAFDLMMSKNHDYDEAWRVMLISSFTDLILSRILRIRQILMNDGKTLVSEGIESNLLDMINYAVFASIRLLENKES